MKLMMVIIRKYPRVCNKTATSKVDRGLHSLVMSTSYAWNVMEGKNNGERSKKSKNRVNVNFVETKLLRKAKNICIANVKLVHGSFSKGTLDPNGA